MTKRSMNNDPTRPVRGAIRTTNASMRYMSLFPMVIGALVILFIWRGTRVGHSPMFFRLFGTVIGLFFIGTGIVAFLGMKSMGRAIEKGVSTTGHETAPRAIDVSECPNCGAGIGPESIMLKDGSITCAYCDTRFPASQSIDDIA